MSSGVTCRVIPSFKMYLSLQQCMRSTFLRNEKTFFCRELTTFTKPPELLSIVRLSHGTIKNRTIFRKEWMSKREALVPVGSNSYCDQSKNTKHEETVVEEKSEEKLTVYQKLKNMFKKYWYVLVPVHLLTSSIWFGSFYYLVCSGVDIPALLQSLGAPDSWLENLRNSKAGNLVLAYTLYKIASPARYTVTIGGTTIAINYLRKWGWIKPVPNPAQLRKIYEEKKGALKDLKASYQDKMQVTKNEFLKTKNEMRRQYKEVTEEFHKTVKGTRDEFKENVNDGVNHWKMYGRAILRKLKLEWREVFGNKK